MQPSAAELRDMLTHRDTRGLRVLMEDGHPGNVAGTLAQLEAQEIVQVLRFARMEEAIEVFEFFSAETQEAIFTGMARKEMAGFLEEMAPDDRADLIKRLNPELAESVLALVAQVDREDIRRLSSYREGTAGAIMTTDYACLPEEITVADALEQLRLQAPDRETIYYVYVVDKNRKLIGLVELKDLIVARPATQRKVSDLMERDVIRVRINDDPIEVAHTIAKYDLIAVPVIDAAGRLVGIVTVDDAMDLLDPEVDEPSASGRDGAKASVLGYVDRAAWATMRSRGAWVMASAFILVCACFAFGGGAGGRNRLLALLIMGFGLPLVLALGVRAGARCAVATARDLAREHPPGRSFLDNFSDELRLGLVAPILVVAVVAGILFLRHGAFTEPHKVFLLFAGISGVAQVIFAALTGGCFAIMAGKTGLSLDRFVAPGILEIPDIAGLCLYFLLLAPRLTAMV